ncbi:unnamed protein product [Adineta ricciae]|uniref:Integral membrane bound transporter domain-containing protein n=1 Tax=Adineta ricciae TaxID=249248 RepID=A0A814W1Z7_ADIRI|nr:unnamed protein product [Adineta ricciae]
MTLSTIFRSIRRFYFNYYHIKTSSIYLHSAFTRRLQYAFRLVLTFLIGSFVAYATPLRLHLGQIYMIPNLGVLCIQETFGATLSTTLHVTSVIIPLSMFLFLIQTLGLSYQNYLVGEILLLLSSFCISYRCRTLQFRKLSLWFNAIFFVSIINEQTIRATFAFELLADFVLGMFVAVLVSLLFFPLFATLDIENRVNYCLFHLDQMQAFLIQAFLCYDSTAAKVSLARAAIVERRLRNTMNETRQRLNEVYLEPCRLLQWIFTRHRNEIFSLSIEQQVDLITSLMFHVCSLQAMIEQCTFNKYHQDLVKQLESNLLDFISNQSMVIDSLISSSLVNTDTFHNRLTNLQLAIESLNSAYKQVRLHRIEEVFLTGTKTQSDDHLSHTFFFFQLDAIARLLTQITTINRQREKTSKTTQVRTCLKDYCKFHFDWPRIISAFKSMLIIGVGSIFVMVPSLANSFANGQWILIGLCMTQGDTVGGALTTMKLRLVGTLLGSMWAYAIYAAVGEESYKIFAMLVPWLLLCGYLKLIPQWDYAATVAASTPIVVNLGRLYGDVFRQGNYVLLRIQESIIGIGVGMFLTVLIFPTFAVDLLKTNIQDTLKTCRRATESIHSVYDQFFQHQHARRYSLSMNEEEEIKFHIDLQRRHFHQLISSQRIQLNYASLEPSIWWFNYGFSPSQYDLLIKQQLDMFRMLHNMHATLMQINDCSMDDKNQIDELRLNAAGGRFLPDLHGELLDLSRQLSDCIDLWISYLTLTHTTYYR